MSDIMATITDQNNIVSNKINIHQPPTPSRSDKVKEVVGIILVSLGILLLAGVFTTLAVYAIAHIAIPLALIDMLFSIALASLLVGFHLSKGDLPPVSFAAKLR